MKLLVTGANGFVGSYFTEKYKDKYKIQKFSFLNDDFNTLDCSEVDVVFHLSALVHQMGGASADEYERMNVVKTLKLAKKAKESGAKQFVFMSTVKVYGEETNDVYTENSKCNPEDEYGKSKLKAEQELSKLVSEDFVVSIVRTPIVYGFGVKANIKNLVSLVKKVPFLPFSGIENRRSMVYVGNLCHLVDEVIGFQIEFGMTGVDEFGMTSGNIFLASDDEPLSTTRLVELIAKELNKKIYLIKIPFFESLLKLLKPSFHKRLYGSLEVDNSLTKERLFEIPNRVGNDVMPYSVEEGVRLMIHGEKLGRDPSLRSG